MRNLSVGRIFIKKDVELKSSCGALPIGLVAVVRLETTPLWLCVVVVWCNRWPLVVVWGVVSLLAVVSGKFFGDVAALYGGSILATG